MDSQVKSNLVPLPPRGQVQPNSPPSLPPFWGGSPCPLRGAFGGPSDGGVIRWPPPVNGGPFDGPPFHRRPPGGLLRVGGGQGPPPYSDYRTPPLTTPLHRGAPLPKDRGPPRPPIPLRRNGAKGKAGGGTD